MDVSCAILAGGRSKRMGMDKAMLRVGEEMLIERVTKRIRNVFEKIFIVSKDNSIYCMGLPVFKDVLPLQNPAVGVLTALLFSETPYVFVVGCDMPFMSERAILYILEEKDNEDIIIPSTEKGFEPLHAVYRRSCIPYLLNNISRGLFRIPDLFPYLSVKVLHSHPSFYVNGFSVFTNINTKEDLELARRMLQGSHKGSHI